MSRRIRRLAAPFLAFVAACGGGSSPDTVPADDGGAGQGGALPEAGPDASSSLGGQGGGAGNAGAAGLGGAGGSSGDAGAAGAGGTAGSSGAGGSAGAGGSPACDDAYPYVDGYTCAEQAAWNKCGEAWLEGWCDISCGRCGGGPDCASLGPDPCPMPSGLPHACRKRFALGVNYAWRSFGADFGGIPAWNQPSVSQSPAAYGADLAAMRAHGASVVRWWVFPDFRSAGITFDASGNPSGLTDTARADILQALALAADRDVHLVPTIFSFDGFRPDRVAQGVQIRSLAPFVTDPQRRTAMIENVVREVARTAASSPHIARLLAWDAMNEPEWAVAPDGGAPAGRNFTPMDDLTAVSLSDMKAFLAEVLAVLAAETPSAYRSVGWAAAKWSWAFGDLTRIDLQSPHIYGWVNEYWPYSSTPAELGYVGVPTVIGECYLQASPFSPDQTSFATAAASWFHNGYAGLWAWDYYSGNVQNPPEPAFDLDLLQAVASEYGCEASYGVPPPSPAASHASADDASLEEQRLWRELQRMRPVDPRRALDLALRGEQLRAGQGRGAEAWKAMVVTLLVELQRMPEARQRARQFLRAHPASRYRPVVQGLTGIHPRPGPP